MADEKKPKDAPPEVGPLYGLLSPHPDPFVEFSWIILTILVLIFLLNALFFSAGGVASFLKDGPQALTPHGILMRHTIPISSLENPIGSRVINVNKTTVFDSPGGKKIGTQPIGAEGKIVRGPVDIDGMRFWYVDYDSGVDGWVKESDLGYLNSKMNILERFIVWFANKLWYIKLFSFLLSLLAIAGIVYLYRKIDSIRKNEMDLLYPQREEVVEAKNPQWERIVDNVQSFDESDWRVAILEADIMLSDLLDKLALPGDTMGDKLKAVEKSDFRTIDNAWEAHKIRNQVAHEGDSFLITHREAKRVIDLYRTVFEEFQMI